MSDSNACEALSPQVLWGERDHVAAIRCSFDDVGVLRGSGVVVSRQAAGFMDPLYFSADSYYALLVQSQLLRPIRLDQDL